MKMARSIWRNSALMVFLSVISGISLLFSSPIFLKKRCYVFDAGDTTFVEKDAFVLKKGDTYVPEKGFGWLSKPSSSFTRKHLTRSRTNLSIDGVSGKTLSFRADLAPGKWWLTIWIEAGMEDSSTVDFFINKEKRELHWHPFRPEAEGRNRIQITYRVYHGPVTVEKDGLQFEFIGKQDSVRLLCLTLYPDPIPNKQVHFSLLEKFKKYGKFRATGSLDSLIEELDQLIKQDSEDVFARYWREQIQFLYLAEKYKDMMGWDWASEQTGMGIFDRYYQAVMILDGLLNRPEVEKYPFFERALWQRGRLLFWLGKERHGLNEIKGAQRDLSILYQIYPEDSLLAMYNGAKIEQPDPCDKLKPEINAPQWAILQREALCRLREIAHWWVNVRQAANGELGGKVDDDVEILRWWPTLILTGDTIALKGWKKLAECAWNHPKVYHGYSKKPRDVEHASEFIADTAPDLVVFSDDSVYLQRLLPTVHYFETLWTGKTKQGHRYFKSTWFSATEVRTDPPRNRDVDYNTRAVKAIRYLAWKTREKKYIRLLHEWTKSWLDASMRTDKGKPAGIVPASIRFPDEAINGDEPTWYKANMFWEYYDWEAHAGVRMLDQFLFTYTLTGDTTLLQPIYSALDLVKKYFDIITNEKKKKSLIPGSPEWAALRLFEERSFWSIISEWRLITGDPKYDDLILRFGLPYIKFRLTNDKKYLLDGLESLLNSVRFNFPLLTSEVLHTDRVYVHDAHHLKAMVTGDCVRSNTSPYYVVTWEKANENFTALVVDAKSDFFSAKLFSFSPQEYEINMRLWQLEPGKYQLSCKTGRRTDQKYFTMKKRGQRIPISLSGKSLLKVIIKKVK